MPTLRVEVLKGKHLDDDDDSFIKMRADNTWFLFYLNDFFLYFSSFFFIFSHIFLQGTPPRSSKSVPTLSGTKLSRSRSLIL